MLMTRNIGGGSNLEQRLAKLENAIKIGNDGSVTIESNGKVRIKGASSVEIEGAVSVVVKGGANVEVQAGAGLTLKGGATTSLQGSIVKLNNGGQPVVRVGDTVITPAGPGTIPTGNATVLA